MWIINVQTNGDYSKLTTLLHLIEEIVTGPYFLEFPDNTRVELQGQDNQVMTSLLSNLAENGFDLPLTGEIHTMADMTLHYGFWDCECAGNGYIHPVTETRCGKCGAEMEDMPNSRLDEVLATFGYQKSISITWSIDDVIEFAKGKDVELSEKEASEILLMVDKFRDPDKGVSWDTIDANMRQHLEGRKP